MKKEGIFVGEMFDQIAGELRSVEWLVLIQREREFGELPDLPLRTCFSNADGHETELLMR
jgi:hypothetical protein